MSVLPTGRNQKMALQLGREDARNKNLGGINCGYKCYSEKPSSLREGGSIKKKDTGKIRTVATSI